MGFVRSHIENMQKMTEQLNDKNYVKNAVSGVFCEELKSLRDLGQQLSSTSMFLT